MLNRRIFVASALSIGAVGAPSRSQAMTDCIFGAIRWDAQYCNTQGAPCYDELKSLGDHKWNFRAPLHAHVTGPDQLRFDDSQASFDAEIAAASKAGLKYWAYLMYGSRGTFDLGHPLMKGLVYHRASAEKMKMRYAMILTTSNFGFTGNYNSAIDDICKLIVDSNYLLVAEKRPVIFIFHQPQLLQGYWGGDMNNMRVAVDALRTKLQSLGFGSPYVIVMSNPVSGLEAIRYALGADAVSEYAIVIKPPGTAPYATLARNVRDYWRQEMQATTGDVLPTVMIGWDTRPRLEHPPSYDHSVHSQYDPSDYVVAPTPEEFAEECHAAAEFIRLNPSRCKARLALIYAWNEDSEGGPLEPTLGDPNASKLNAARQYME